MFYSLPVMFALNAPFVQYIGVVPNTAL